MKTEANDIQSIISSATEPAELKIAHEEIDRYMKRIVYQVELHEVRGLFTEINRLHHSIKSKAIKLAEIELNIKETDRFCWGMMGSGAREEQTVRTDQDNCLFYDEGTMKEEVVSFSSAGVKNLAEAGYPLCSGNVMATNPRWNFASTVWNDSHIPPIVFEDVRYAYILLDVIPIYGNASLLNKVKEKWKLTLCNDGQLLVKMRETAANLHVPLSPLGKIFTERYGNQAGKFNIKIHAYAPLIIAVKYLSLMAGINEVNTYTRLERLSQRGIIDEYLRRELTSALDLFLLLRLNNSAFTPFHKVPLDYIDLESLTKENAHLLKKGLKIVKKLQKVLKRRGCECEAPEQ
ncbi:putative nucleotidyltransferase substrate binding domain-containing protein [Fictibacillus iocasae]|uniref:Nucleotidyltransferase substrate binding domain-containing protein n=1 Tax=Fictibacillus iocasae TaxID=2715437 RepID=A0ABW2NJI5_9BACL